MKETVRLVKDVKFCPWCGTTNIKQTKDWNKFACKECNVVWWV